MLGCVVALVAGMPMVTAEAATRQGSHSCPTTIPTVVITSKAASSTTYRNALTHTYTAAGTTKEQRWTGTSAAILQTRKTYTNVRIVGNWKVDAEVIVSATGACS